MTATLDAPRTDTDAPATSDLRVKVYSGDRNGRQGGPHNVIVTDGARVYDLPHRKVKHSPTGFSWGYGGSGPAELALNMILDAVGDAAICQACEGRGHRHGAESGFCVECMGEGTTDIARPRVYQAFKFEHVARWGDSFSITAAEVVAFAEGHVFHHEPEGSST